MLNADTILEQMNAAGDAWADANAAAELLEETKKILLAHLVSDAPGTSMAAREAWAHKHDSYHEHIGAMVEARKKANKARIRYEDMKIWAELKRTQAANERAANRHAV